MSDHKKDSENLARMIESTPENLPLRWRTCKNALKKVSDRVYFWRIFRVLSAAPTDPERKEKK